MGKAFATLCAVAGLTAAISASVIPVGLTGDVAVTASYKGKGTVDSKHAILVFLFDHPTPTASSAPLAMEVITRNGETVTFKNIAAGTLYVTLVYDERSTYDGRGGSPPAGTPIGSYVKAGKAVPIKPGPDARVTVAFDDSRRWQ